MAIYINLLAITYILSFIVKKTGKNKYLKGFITGLLMLPLVAISGFRYGVGTDFYTYQLIYEIISRKSFYQVLVSGEVGFELLNWICSRLGYSPQVMFFIMGLLTVSIMVIAINKYSNQFELSMFLYLTTLVYFTPFNIVRQGFAAAVIFYGMKYIYTEKTIKYIMLILFAATFHNSALIMIPIYFIVRHNSKSKVMKGIWLFGLIGYVLFEKIWSGLFKILGILGFNRYVSLYLDIDNGGVHILRVLVAAAPAVIGYMFYKQLKVKNDKIDILINLSVVNFIIMLLALKATYLARINLYVEVYNILLIPYFIGLFNKKDRLLIYIIIVVLFFVFMLTQLPTQANLLPYNNILNLK